MVISFACSSDVWYRTKRGQRACSAAYFSAVLDHTRVIDSKLTILRTRIKVTYMRHAPIMPREICAAEFYNANGDQQNHGQGTRSQSLRAAHSKDEPLQDDRARRFGSKNTERSFCCGADRHLSSCKLTCTNWEASRLYCMHPDKFARIVLCDSLTVNQEPVTLHSVNT